MRRIRAAIAALCTTGLIATVQPATTHAMTNTVIQAKLRRIIVLDQLARTAPHAVDTGCERTIKVPGQGASCWDPRTDLWRVPTTSGPALTHGPDVIAAWAGDPMQTHLSNADAASVAAASTSSISCAVNTRQPHYLAIYARPSTRPASSAIPDELRESLYQASAFVNAQMHDSDPARSARIRFACDPNGSPTVAEIVLPTVAADATFASIVSDLKAAGYGDDPDSAERYVVYYDDRVGTSGADTIGMSGQADAPESDVPGQASLNNRGDYFAVTYASIDFAPWWPSLLHEITHTEGAVPNDAPQSTGAGHCNVDYDIMCYADGGPAGKTATVECATTAYDCGNDTYFAPDPAPGSWIATHWNIAALYNRFLDFGDETLDLTPPSEPQPATVSNLTGHSAQIDWSIPLDDTATTAVTIGYRTCGCTPYTLDSVPAPATSATLELAPDTSYQIDLTAQDAAGNTSIPSTPITVTTGADDEAPSQPQILTADPTAEATQLAWIPSTDNVAVTGYTIDEQLDTGWTPIASVPPQTSYLLTSLAPNATYTIRVEAFDALDNRSSPALVTFTTPQADTALPSLPPETSIPIFTSPTPPSLAVAEPFTPPIAGAAPAHAAQPQALSAPRGSRARSAGRGAWTVSWQPPAGNVRGYAVSYRRSGAPWTTIPPLPAARTHVRIRLPERGRYTIRIAAIGAHRQRATTSIVVTTR